MNAIVPPAIIMMRISIGIAKDYQNKKSRPVSRTQSRGRFLSVNFVLPVIFARFYLLQNVNSMRFYY
jgi:hypothetical protein